MEAHGGVSAQLLGQEEFVVACESLGTLSSKTIQQDLSLVQLQVGSPAVNLQVPAPQRTRSRFRRLPSSTMCFARPPLTRTCEPTCFDDDGWKGSVGLPS